MKALRYVRVVLGAGAASWLLPMLMLVYSGFTDTGFDRLGEVDNAPRRAMFVLLLMSPIIISLSGIAIFFLASVLQTFRKYSLKTFAGTSGVLGLAFGLLLTIPIVHNDKLTDILIVGGSLSLGGLVCMILGSLAWWRLSPWEVA